MDDITAAAGFQAYFDRKLADNLWDNTRKQKNNQDIALVKNYILTITDALGMLEQKLSFVVSTLLPKLRVIKITK